MTSKIEQRMDEVLEALIQEGTIVGPFGECLALLTERVTGEYPTRPFGSHGGYHQTAAAVVRLEAIGLVVVEREHRDESARANIVTAISLA